MKPLAELINTDEPGPVLARVVNSPLNGSKLIGSMGVTGPYSESAYISFSTVSIPAMDRSIGLSTVAIDPKTARTALATDVNKHLLLRYGTLIASSFLVGMSDAVLSAIDNPGFEVSESGVIIRA